MKKNARQVHSCTFNCKFAIFICIIKNSSNSAIYKNAKPPKCLASIIHQLQKVYGFRFPVLIQSILHLSKEKNGLENDLQETAKNAADGRWMPNTSVVFFSFLQFMDRWFLLLFTANPVDMGFSQKHMREIGFGGFACGISHDWNSWILAGFFLGRTIPVDSQNFPGY